MAIEAVKKVYILGHREIEGEVIGALQELGVVEPSETGPVFGAGAAAPFSGERELDRKLELLDHVLGLLARFAPPRGFLAGGEKVLLSRREMEEIVARDDHEEIHRQCRELEQRLADQKNRRIRLHAELAQITPWINLSVPFDRLASTPSVRIDVGSVPQNLFAAFREALAACGEQTALYEINADGRARYLILFSTAEAGILEEVLREHEFASLPFPEGDYSPRETVDRLNRELQQIHREEGHLGEAFKALYANRPRLLALRDHYANILVREKARGFLARTEASFCLTGWAPAHETARIENELKGRFAALEVMFADPGGEETVPIILKNAPLAEPFEVITDLYGRPVYRGIDPTPYLAPFFATFFGFCLTDAGYGIVVMLITAFLLWWPGRRHPQGTAKKFFELFFLGGIATVLLGAMVGGWFGVTVEWKLFDALGNLFIFFGLALALGLLHLFTGLSIKMVRNMKAGDVAGGLYDQGLWMLIITALIGYGLSRAKILSLSLQFPAAAVSLGSALAIVFFHGRGTDKNAAKFKGWLGSAYQALWLGLTVALTLHLMSIGRPLSGYLSLAAAALILAAGARNFGSILARVGLGLYSLYGISGFLGDTLSYTRLVALGLSTGIVAMIVNKMAGIALGTPWIGWLMALLILIGGHAFNIAINLLGAFVHSCRLQYVEFFTKFYEGGGRPFRPFGFSYRHTIINK